MKFLLPLAALSGAAATPAWPKSFSTAQPSGRSTACLMKMMGDPSYHFVVCEEAPAGSYTTIIDQTDGYIKYAELDSNGRLTPSKHIVGEVNPEEALLPMHVVESIETVEAKCLENEYCAWKLDNNGLEGAAGPTGDWHNLVIPFYFADHTDRTMKIEEMKVDTFNDDVSSVKDFFSDMSGGKLNVVNSFVPAITISKSESECADNVSGTSSKIKECLKEAFEATGEDIADYHGVTFVHSGYGAEFGGRDEYNTYYDDRIWSHSWAIDGLGRYALFSGFFGRDNENYQRIGMAIHQIAQVVGAPTMYGPLPGSGLGNYDVMASPYGFDGTEHHPGALSAFTKAYLGWADIEEISADGEFTIDSLSNKVYKITEGFPADEYLLIEARLSVGYDKGMRGPGLCIYHVDDTKSFSSRPGYPGDGTFPKNHYRVALIQADGLFDLEHGEDDGDNGDTFENDRINGVGPHGPLAHDELLNQKYPNTDSYSSGTFESSGVTISAVSDPGEKMTFKVEFGDASQA